MDYIGKNIKYLRLKRGMKQPELGKLVGKAENTIQSWESGYRCPTMESVKRLSEVFGVSMNDLVNTDLTVKNAIPVPELTKGEWEMIEMFRALDEHGQDIVLMLLESEYTRCSGNETFSQTVLNCAINVKR